MFVMRLIWLTKPFRSLGFLARHVTPSSCGKAAMNGLANTLHAKRESINA
jgi:hypothetical protein